jgi:hypothetical protein
VNGEQEHWDLNYFNYFTEVEERFQQARGTALFLLSPLDWALIEDWKNGGVPLEAALRGIDRAFEKWRSGRSKIRTINSLAYCAQAVLEEAEAMQGVSTQPSRPPVAAPFELDELRAYLARNAADLRKQAGTAYHEIAASLEALAAEAATKFENLEDLERHLTVLEEKMMAFARTQQREEDMLAARRALDLELRPYRGKMSADQLARLERQYLDRRLLESLGLPRLSLFYMR